MSIGAIATGLACACSSFSATNDEPTPGLPDASANDAQTAGDGDAGTFCDVPGAFFCDRFDSTWPAGWDSIEPATGKAALDSITFLSRPSSLALSKSIGGVAGNLQITKTAQWPASSSQAFLEASFFRTQGKDLAFLRFPSKPLVVLVSSEALTFYESESSYDRRTLDVAAPLKQWSRVRLTIHRDTHQATLSVDGSPAGTLDLPADPLAGATSISMSLGTTYIGESDTYQLNVDDVVLGRL